MVVDVVVRVVAVAVDVAVAVAAAAAAAVVVVAAAYSYFWHRNVDHDHNAAVDIHADSLYVPDGYSDSTVGVASLVQFGPVVDAL